MRFYLLPLLTLILAYPLEGAASLEPGVIDSVSPSLRGMFYLAGLAVDPEGNLLAADFGGHRILRILPSGDWQIVAGTGIPGFSGDGGPATQARLRNPFTLLPDEKGGFYFTDSGNGRLRYVDPAGYIITIAGGGSLTRTNNPLHLRLLGLGGIARDREGNLYFADGQANRIYKLDRQGQVHIVVGTGYLGFSPDGTPAEQASLQIPGGIALDEEGRLYFAEWRGHRVRRVNTEGKLETVAGTGQPGSKGDGGPSLKAQLNRPWDIALWKGSLYIAEAGSYKVRRVSPEGMIQTVAGNGQARSSGDGGSALEAGIPQLCCLTFDPQGQLYVNDAEQGVRRVTFGPLIKGDLNGDGQQTLRDLQLLFRALVHSQRLTIYQQQSADINQDGLVTLADAVQWLRLYLH